MSLQGCVHYGAHRGKEKGWFLHICTSNSFKPQLIVIDPFNYRINALDHVSQLVLYTQECRTKKLKNYGKNANKKIEQFQEEQQSLN